MDWLGYVLLAVAAIVGLVGARLVYVWYTRIRPLEPSLDLEWAADCEHLTTATMELSLIHI